MRQMVKNIFTEATSKEVRSILPLNDGFSNENYLVNDAYVLRLTYPNCDPCIDRANEKKVYELIDPLKISDKVIFFNESNGTKISKFIHCPKRYTENYDATQITLVAKCLRKLHLSNIKVDVDYNAFAKIDVYKTLLEENELVNSDYENFVFNQIKKFEAKEEKTLCHNDIVKGNLLFKFNTLYLIDWEYAAMNTIYFDLASFISENNLNEDDEVLFLKKYFGYKYSEHKKKVVDLYCDFQDILFYYWGKYLYKKRGVPVFKEIASLKFKRLSIKASTFTN